MSAEEEKVRYTGRVKWFNNKSGFGFITQCDGQNDKDIFVHWSSIKVENSQYKYLVQGEYVDFCLVKPERSDHEFHAVEVSGVKGGSLMCETRRESFNTQRVAKRAGGSDSDRPIRNVSKRPSGNVPRDGDTEGYTRVVKRRGGARKGVKGETSREVVAQV